MKRRPTINDVARKAGLSISTVSLVINKKENVSEETRQKVLTIIEDLGYHPHHSARGLASKLSGNLGFILSDDHFSQAEPFYTKIFLGTEFEARSHNYYILLTSVANRFKPGESIPRFLLERNVDGVIIAGKVDRKLIEHIGALNIPLVLVDFASPRKNISSIQIDNEGGAQMAVGHLVKLGHRSIGFVGGDIHHPSIEQRYEGYKKVLTDNGMTVDPALISIEEADTGIENGTRAAERLFAKSAPTAIFAANDAMAVGVLQYARRTGRRVPDDVAIIGFDDVELGSLVEPRLSTIRVFKEEMGKLAVRHLLDVIKSGMSTVALMHIPVELVIRESTTPTTVAQLHEVAP